MPFPIGTVNDKKVKLGITKDLLVDLYWRQSLSTQDIALQYETTRVTVARWLRYFGVPVRQSKNFESCKYDSGVTEASYESTKFDAVEVPLTSFQKSFLLGTLCGDGCLKVPTEMSDKSYYSGHHGPKQSQYLLHKSEIMKPLTSRLYVAPDGSVETDTISVSELRPWYDSIYSRNGCKKFLDRWIFEHLDSIGLTYWYLDDGGVNRGHYVINCHTDGVYDPVCTVKLLSDRFNLPVSKHNSHTNGMVSFYIPTDGAGRFTEILLKHTPESMRWKIHPWFGKVLGVGVECD